MISNIDVDTEYQKLIYHQNTPALVTSNIYHHCYILVNVESSHIYLCDSNWTHLQFLAFLGED